SIKQITKQETAARPREICGHAVTGPRFRHTLAFGPRLGNFGYESGGFYSLTLPRLPPLWNPNCDIRIKECKEGQSMERAVQPALDVLSRGASGKDESRRFSIESVIRLEKLIFAGSPLSEVLTYIAQLVEAQAEGISCTIWLPDADGRELY